MPQLDLGRLGWYDPPDLRMPIPSVDDPPSYTVPLDGYTMHLRPSEIDAVTAGLAELDARQTVTPTNLVEALRGMPTVDRPPVWELAIRRFGRGKPLPQAASEIGMDVIHARDLLDRLSSALPGVSASTR